MLMVTTEKKEAGLEMCDSGRVTLLGMSGGGLTGGDLSQGRELAI